MVPTARTIPSRYLMTPPSVTWGPGDAQAYAAIRCVDAEDVHSIPLPVCREGEACADAEDGMRFTIHREGHEPLLADLVEGDRERGLIREEGGLIAVMECDVDGRFGNG